MRDTVVQKNTINKTDGISEKPERKMKQKQDITQNLKRDS